LFQFLGIKKFDKFLITHKVGNLGPAEMKGLYRLGQVQQVTFERLSELNMNLMQKGRGDIGNEGQLPHVKIYIV
jgi:hypothetical protein